MNFSWIFHHFDVEFESDHAYQISNLYRLLPLNIITKTTKTANNKKVHFKDIPLFNLHPEKNLKGAL